MLLGAHLSRRWLMVANAAQSFGDRGRHRRDDAIDFGEPAGDFVFELLRCAVVPSSPLAASVAAWTTRKRWLWKKKKKKKKKKPLAGLWEAQLAGSGGGNSMVSKAAPCPSDFELFSSSSSSSSLAIFGPSRSSLASFSASLGTSPAASPGAQARNVSPLRHIRVVLVVAAAAASSTSSRHHLAPEPPSPQAPSRWRRLFRVVRAPCFSSSKGVLAPPAYRRSSPPPQR